MYNDTSCITTLYNDWSSLINIHLHINVLENSSLNFLQLMYQLVYNCFFTVLPVAHAYHFTDVQGSVCVWGGGGGWSVSQS